MIISIDAKKKTLDKIQHPFMIKTLESGFRGNLPQHNTRPLYSKPTVRQPSGREKIFANKATEKGLISKICKHLMQFNIKKKTSMDSQGVWNGHVHAAIFKT